jgi:O-antigen/teichoic acid export membrane protein
MAAVNLTWPITGLRHLLRKSDGAKRLVIGTGFGGLALIFNRLVTIGTAIVFTRMLGVEGYGIYGFAIALLGIIGVFCELGLASLVVREVARAHTRFAWDEMKGLFASAVSIVIKSWLAIAAAGAAVLVFVPFHLVSAQRTTLALMLVLVVFFVLIRVVAAILNGLRKVVASQFIEQALAPGLLFLAALGLAFGFGTTRLAPQTAIIIQLASAIIALGVGVAVLKRALAEGRDVPPAKFSQRDLVRRARPFLLIRSAILLATQLDVVLVNLFLGNKATGLYRVASQGAVLLNACMQVITSVSMPYFARLFVNGDKTNLRRLYRLAAAAGFAFAAVLFAAFVFEGRLLIGLLFGKAFVPTYPILLILSAGYVGYASFGPAGAMLTMAGYEMMAVWTFWATALLNLVGGITAALLFGVEGVAAMTAITITLNNGALYLMVRRKIGF